MSVNQTDFDQYKLDVKDRQESLEETIRIQNAKINTDMIELRQALNVQLPHSDSEDNMDIMINTHMRDINAAIGIIQLKRIPSFQKKRKLLAKNYDAVFANSSFIKIFQRNNDEITPHIYVVSLAQSESRDELQKYLLIFY